MKREVLIKLVSIGLALITVTIVVVFKSNEKNEDVSKEASAIFGDFSSAIDRLSDLLNLFLEAEESDEIDEIAQNLSEELRRARQDYALLNSTKVESGLDTFLNLSGDYILKYADDIKQGKVGNEQRNKLEKLKTVANRFSHELSKIEPTQGAEKITEEIMSSYLKVNREITENEESGPSFNSSQSQPTETFDNGNPLSGAEQIGEERALEIARMYIDAQEELTAEKTKINEIDVFYFKGENEEVCVSVKGGFVVSFSRKKSEEIKNYSAEQCIALARDFLSNYHSANFTPRYFEDAQQTCLIIFTTKNGATYCNPDRVEITVSKECGEIVSFSAEQFLQNHRNRTLQAPSHTAEQAQEVIPSNLSVEQVWQVIEKTNEGEEMCFEFYCTSQENGEELVYVNTQNLEIKEKTKVTKNKNSAFLK